MTTFTSSRRRCTKALIWIASVAIAAFAADAWGQTSNGTQWRRGTTLGGFAGIASTEGATAAVGTTLGWEVIPHLTLEGRGVWLRETGRATDFLASFGALVPVRPAGAVVPFVSAGIGMYRATVEADAADVADFYRRRLATRASATFEDLTLSYGGGANVFVTPHIALRPEVSVIVVTTRAETRTVPLYGVQVAYHFEPHNVR